MTTRITAASLAPVVAAQGQALDKILELLQAQHATPTAVADAVVETKPEPEAKPATASDELFAHVAEQGLAFAKGGRSYLTADHLKAAVRVLRTGKPEVLAYDGDSKLAKRGVTHIAMAREDGSVLTQFVYQPSK